MRYPYLLIPPNKSSSSSFSLYFNLQPSQLKCKYTDLDNHLLGHP